MVPTYHHNDVLIHEKIAYKFSKPKINDIITVDLPENILGKKEKIIKRVVAVGGDTITIKNNVFYRNGEKVNEPYINEKMNTTDFANIDEYTLEDDEVFVMGDNRNHSTDSRYFGAVPIKYVKSKVIIYNKTFSNIMKSFYKFVGAM